MTDVFIVDACRTPMGRIGGQLAAVRPDDLAAHVVRALMDRNPSLEAVDVEDVVWGAANQAGEDNRNVARMATLLAGLGIEIPGQTVNRLCGSGLQAVITAAQSLVAGWGDVMIAGGSEAMSRAPFVVTKPERGYAVGAPSNGGHGTGMAAGKPPHAGHVPAHQHGRDRRGGRLQVRSDPDRSGPVRLDQPPETLSPPSRPEDSMTR